MRDRTFTEDVWPKATSRRGLSAVVLLVLCFAPWATRAQMVVAHSILTYAGNGTAGLSGNGGAAAAAELNGPSGIAVDGLGNLYIADVANYVVREVNASTGVISTIAGNGTAGFSGDGGPATAAEIRPVDVAVDGLGSLYIADTLNQRIRRVNLASGIITTVAGSGTQGHSGDGGQAASAALNAPWAVAADGSNNIYIADTGNNCVRYLNVATGVITNIAGTGASGSTGDGGAATAATLKTPTGVAVSAAGNLYIADTGNGVIREVTLASGKIATVAGTIGATGSGTPHPSPGDGGPATLATLSAPVGITLDAVGNLYIADIGDNALRVVNTSGTISTIAGTDAAGYSGDGGLATSAELRSPAHVALDPMGNIYVSDDGNNRVRRVGMNLTFVPTALGSSVTQNILLQATAAETISAPSVTTSLGSVQEFSVGAVSGCTDDGSTSNASGTICTVPVTFQPRYPGNRALPLKVTAGGTKYRFIVNGRGEGPLTALIPGIITTIAGIGTAGYTGDGSAATASQLNTPSRVAVDFAGNVYIVDVGNNVIRKVSATTGIITTVAGNGTGGYNGDGIAATSAELSNPLAVTVDGAGNLFITDANNQRIREVVNTTGLIQTVAGNGTNGFAGDGGLATSAALSNPWETALDQAGNLYIADGSNSRLRMVNAATGVITTIAGTGAVSFSGDGGQATAAGLRYPGAIALDQHGNIVFSDSFDKRIRTISALTGVVNTVAGTGSPGYSGDGGPATSAQIGVIQGVVLDSAGNIYLADAANSRIRRVDALTNTITTIAGNGIVGYAGDGGSATSAALNSPYHVAIDAKGNLYIADPVANVIRKITVSQSALAFPTATSAGDRDLSDDPLTTVVNNIGNAALTIPPPSTGLNPSIASYFSLDSSSTCSQLSSASTSETLATAAQCTIAIDFTPTVAGSVSGTAVLTNNSLGVAGSSQSIALSGTATADVTATTLLSSANPGLYGSNVTITATVTDSSAGTVPTGSIQFTLDGTVVSTVTLNGSGTAAYTATSLSIGTHSFTAAYTPSGSFSASTSGALSEIVSKATPAITWPAPAAIPYGTALSSTQLNASTTTTGGTFTYTPAAGTVLSVGAAQSLSTTFTPTDTTHYAAASATNTITVTQAAGSVALTSSTSSAVFGSAITLTATLPTGASGAVVFTDGGLTIGTGTISNGGASLVVSNLLVGSHSLAATWAGNAAYTSAASLSVPLVITKSPVTIAFATSRDPSLYGDMVICTVTVSGPLTTPTGSLLLKDGSSVLGTLSLVSGNATYTTRSLVAGSHTLELIYSGDSNFY